MGEGSERGRVGRRVAAARRAAAETLPEWFDISPERITLSDSGLLFWNTVAETIL